MKEAKSAPTRQLRHYLWGNYRVGRDVPAELVCEGWAVDDYLHEKLLVEASSLSATAIAARHFSIWQ